MGAVRKIQEFFGLEPLDPDAEENFYEQASHTSMVQDSPVYETTRYHNYDSTPYASEYRRGESSRLSSSDTHSSSTQRRYPTIVTVTAREYRDAVSVAQPFMEGHAVVLDITDMARDDALRIVDFTVGLAYGLNGTTRKLAPRLFAVLPEGCLYDDEELQAAVRY